MESLWVGSDVDLSTLHKCRMAERLEYRLACLHKLKPSKSCNFAGNKLDPERDIKFQEDEDHFKRRRRSGTWP